MKNDTAHLEQIKQQLISRSFLYDDPGAYRAGVEEAIGAMRRDLQPETPPEAHRGLQEGRRAS